MRERRKRGRQCAAGEAEKEARQAWQQARRRWQAREGSCVIGSPPPSSLSGLPVVSRQVLKMEGEDANAPFCLPSSVPDQERAAGRKEAGQEAGRRMSRNPGRQEGKNLKVVQRVFVFHVATIRSREGVSCVGDGQCPQPQPKACLRKHGIEEEREKRSRLPRFRGGEASSSRRKPAWCCSMPRVAMPLRGTERLPLLSRRIRH